MRVLCGYTEAGRRQECKNALYLNAECKGQPVDYVEMTGPFDYWDAIAERWTGDEDLVIVEHDNVITADTLPSFAACGNLWCVYGYPCFLLHPEPAHMGRLLYGLGCTKFSAELQRQVPIDAIAMSVVWTSVDAMIGTNLEWRGLAPHDHGDVEHLHDYTDEVAKAWPVRGEPTIENANAGAMRICGDWATERNRIVPEVFRTAD